MFILWGALKKTEITVNLNLPASVAHDKLKSLIKQAREEWTDPAQIPLPSQTKGERNYE